MKIIFSLLVVSSAMYAELINGQQYKDMMEAAHVQKTFEKVYFTEKEPEPKIEVVKDSAPVSVAVEGESVPDDECAADKKENNVSH